MNRPAPPQPRKRVLLVWPLGEPPLAEDRETVEQEGYDWSSVSLDVADVGSFAKTLGPLRAIRQILAADIVFSVDAHVTLGTALVMSALRMKKPHVAFTFNLTNRHRFHPVLEVLARRVLKSVTFFVTPSDLEREVFASRYGIPVERFAFEHWGVPGSVRPDPAAAPEMFRAKQPYFCAIGRNNRDFATFAEALRGSPYQGIIITSRGLVDEARLPSNVSVLYEVSAEQCFQCISAAVANVVPIKDPGIGAGHMTMVHAMHMGVAQIVTTSAPVADYFLPGEHGLGVGLGDVRGLRAAMDEIHARPDEARAMGERAQEFARKWLSGWQRSAITRAVLKALRGEGAFPTAPPGWREWQAARAVAPESAREG